MKQTRYLLLGFVALFALGAALYSRMDARHDSFQESIYVFGTLVDITLREVTESQARAVFGEITREFQQMHRDWHPWEPGPLTRLNAALAAGEPAPVPPSLLPVIEQSRQLEVQSEGLFSPALGGLLELWGFQRRGGATGAPPDPDAIAAWLQQRPTMADLEFAGDLLGTANPRVQLNFGAHAKGYAVDVAVGILRRHGVEHGIVNAGGDLRAIGQRGNAPWRVGIRHPQGSGVLGALEISGDEAVVTSGNYERYREHEGVRYSHILDPRTGMPVDDVVSVTVVHDNAAVADAAATALVVAGPEQWHRIARRMGIRYVLLVDGDGVLHMNPEMAARLEVRGAEEHAIVLSDPL